MAEEILTTDDGTEEGHGVGAIFTEPDPRDFVYGEQIGMAASPFDWEKGFDVEEEISDMLGEKFKLKSKDQNGSGSCGGQAWAYFGEILTTISTKKVAEKSAKFIYAQTFVPPAGSDGRTNSALVMKQGWCDEKEVVSYENGLPPKEPFMQRKDDIEGEDRTKALSHKALAYATVDTKDIDSVAQAIRDQKGVILGIVGTNNATWRSMYPKPPKQGESQWYHWIYAGKAKMIKGKKMIGLKNSWGDSTGDDGWQWIEESYLKNFANGRASVWVGFVLFFDKSGIMGSSQNLFSQVLRYKMPKNGDVKRLQMILGLTDDGIFGKKTLEAVKKFQREHDLVSDGIVGLLTQAQMKISFKL